MHVHVVAHAHEQLTHATHSCVPQLGDLVCTIPRTEGHQRRLVSVCRHLVALEELVEGFWSKFKDCRKTRPVKVRLVIQSESPIGEGSCLYGWPDSLLSVRAEDHQLQDVVCQKQTLN